MLNIAKIKSLAKSKGVSITFICEKLGRGPYYLNDLKKTNADLPDDRLAIIADILGTTTAYLRDETDDPSPQKEKAPSPPFDGENAKYNELISLLDQMDDKTLSRFIELAHLASLSDEEFDRAIAILRLAIPGELS